MPSTASDRAEFFLVVAFNSHSNPECQSLGNCFSHPRNVRRKFRSFSQNRWRRYSQPRVLFGEHFDHALKISMLLMPRIGLVGI